MVRTSVLLLLALSLSTTLSQACGTIRMWHQKYFEATTDVARLDALKFIHCEPIVANFKFETEETALLLELVDNALSRSGVMGQYAHAYQSYAVKLYLVYGLYRGSDAVIEHSMVQEEVGELFGISYFPFDPDFKVRVGERLAVFQPFGTFYSTMDYVTELDRQFSALQQALNRPVSLSTDDNLTAGGTPISITLTGQADRAQNEFFPQQLVISGSISQTIVMPNTCLCEWQGTGRSVLGHVQLEDLNFDGYRDLRAFDNAGATGNRWDVIWLYDAASQQFLYSDELSGLSALRAKPASKTLESFETQGWCSQQWTTYTWQAGELVPLRARYTEADEQSGTCELVKGIYEEGDFVEQYREAYNGER